VPCRLQQHGVCIVREHAAVSMHLCHTAVQAPEMQLHTQHAIVACTPFQLTHHGPLIFLRIPPPSRHATCSYSLKQIKDFGRAHKFYCFSWIRVRQTQIIHSQLQIQCSSIAWWLKATCVFLPLSSTVEVGFFHPLRCLQFCQPPARLLAHVCQRWYASYHTSPSTGCCCAQCPAHVTACT
jgi:hypothetical protein